MTKQITIIDSLMGSGKTSWIIEQMNQSQGRVTMTPNRYLYITPILDEVNRIVRDCDGLNFRQPETREHGSKYFNLKKLIEEGANIASTHALFKYMEGDLASQIEEKQYTLVIDEVLDCASFLDDRDLSTADRRILFENNLVFIDEQRRVKWNYDNPSVADYNGGRFTKIKNLCGNLGDNTSKRTMLLWVFPAEFLSLFKEVIVMTYMFDGSPMKPYLESHGFVFKRRTIIGDHESGFEVAPVWEDPEVKRKRHIRNLISVYDGRSNAVGNHTTGEQPLSKGWYGREKKRKTQGKPNGIDKLNRGITSFFSNVAKSSSKENAVVTFAEYRSSLTGRGYGKVNYHHIPTNAKATNDWANRTAMAYTVNRFNHSMIQSWLKAQGVPVNDDLFAIAEMVQVVWRTAIRDDQPIHLYIPSQRMRELFLAWLHSDTIEEFVDHCEGKQQQAVA
ncbi:MAG: hypothetical protein LC687_05765 [Actinobacteria bacterium]|nr:hypothetical protein [Actinomycetota bacterium]